MSFGLKLKLKKLYIKFLNWMSGDGFSMPEMDLKSQCIYNYCKSILKEENIRPIQAYEKILEDLIIKYPSSSRKDAAQSYVSAMEWVHDMKGDK